MAASMEVYSAICYLVGITFMQVRLDVELSRCLDLVHTEK